MVILLTLVMLLTQNMVCNTLKMVIVKQQKLDMLMVEPWPLVMKIVDSGALEIVMVKRWIILQLTVCSRSLEDVSKVITLAKLVEEDLMPCSQVCSLMSSDPPHHSGVLLRPQLDGGGHQAPGGGVDRSV